MDIPIIGVVKPGADAAVRSTRSGRIGIIGTSGTISSGIYDRYIKDRLPGAKVFGKACPLFVHLVEEGMIDDSVTVEMIHRYLDEMIENAHIDTLILGCTHYPLLRSVIAREIGGTYADFSETGTEPFAGSSSDDLRNIVLVNPAYTTAMELSSLLNEQDLASSGPVSISDHRFYVSDGPESFRRFASGVLDINISDVSLKILE